MLESQPSKIKLWLLAIRPKTLPAAVAPVAVGSAAAYSAGFFMLLPALGCIFGATLLQIGVNVANDYFVYKNEIDSDQRQGPIRVTQSGLIPPEVVRRGIVISLTLAGLVFVYLAAVGGMPIVIVGVFSIVAALGYSGGPYPLASHGLGELFVFIFFGIVAVGATYYIQAKELSWFVMLCSVPPGLLITAIMVINNLRDIDTDSKAGKITLAVRLGRYRTIIFYKMLVYGSYLVPVLLVAVQEAGAFTLLPLGTVFMAWSLSMKVECDLGSNLNELLASTARLSLVFSLLFSFGLVYTI
jgi:1,4-dihydroxy-2-naphthoate octaprenyltransferase